MIEQSIAAVALAGAAFWLLAALATTVFVLVWR